MLVIGIDPGSKYTGFGIIEKKGQDFNYIDSGIINLSKIKNIQAKLKKLYLEFSNLLDRYSPDSIAVEDIFYAKNIKSTIKLGYIKGTIFLASAHKDIAVFEYTPTNVKSAITCNGRATKESVRSMLCNLIKNLPENYFKIDESDALSIAYCHLITKIFNDKIKG